MDINEASIIKKMALLIIDTIQIGAIKQENTSRL